MKGAPSADATHAAVLRGSGTDEGGGGGVSGEEGCDSSPSESGSRRFRLLRSMLVKVPGSPSAGMCTPAGIRVLGGFAGRDFAAVGFPGLEGGPGRLPPLPEEAMLAPPAAAKDQGSMTKIADH